MTMLMASRKFMLVVMAVSLCVLSVSGCSSLRKKFTRTPKGAKTEDVFIPVLEPVEYKKTEETPQQIYQIHYSTLQAYFKDLWDALGKSSGGEKREKYILTEMLSHFDFMAGQLSQVKKAELDAVRAHIIKVLKEYDKPQGMRRYDRMSSDMRAVEREINREFKPGIVASALVVAGK